MLCLLLSPHTHYTYIHVTDAQMLHRLMLILMMMMTMWMLVVKSCLQYECTRYLRVSDIHQFGAVHCAYALKITPIGDELAAVV
jgi:hypothetical protein